MRAVNRRVPDSAQGCPGTARAASRNVHGQGEPDAHEPLSDPQPVHDVLGPEVPVVGVVPLGRPAERGAFCRQPRPVPDAVGQHDVRDDAAQGHA